MLGSNKGSLQYRTNRRIFLVLAAVALLAQSACKKNNTEGAPVISRLRAISPAPNDSTLTTALPGQIVVIQGSNLAAATQVYFNGFAASLNPALFTNKNLVVTVPAIAWDSIPNGKLNTVEVITPGGHASYKFNIIAPLPVATTASNENALPGETITLVGSNFYSLTKIVFPGGIPVTNFKVSPDSKQVTVTVPAGITTGDSLRITGIYGTGTSSFVFDNYLAETTGFLADFECCGAHFGWQWWGGIKTNDGTLFPGNTGAYIEVHPVNTPITSGNGSWYSDNRAVMVAASPWVDNMSNPVANYALKFEMSTRVPWTAGDMILRTSAVQTDGKTWAYLARYAPWETSSSGQFATNGWTTITIPLTQFLSTSSGNGNYNSSGSPATSFAALMGGNSSECDFMLNNDGKAAITAFDAAFDNVRIVKMK